MPILLWLLGVPLSIVVILMLFGVDAAVDRVWLSATE